MLTGPDGEMLEGRSAWLEVYCLDGTERQETWQQLVPAHPFPIEYVRTAHAEGGEQSLPSGSSSTPEQRLVPTEHVRTVHARGAAQPLPLGSSTTPKQQPGGNMPTARYDCVTTQITNHLRCCISPNDSVACN
jgi:hypothetical protein